ANAGAAIATKPNATVSRTSLFMWISAIVETTIREGAIGAFSNAGRAARERFDVELSPLARSLQPKPHAAHRCDARRALQRREAPTPMATVDVHGLSRGRLLLTPDLIEQLPPGDDFARVPGEAGEHVHLPRRQNHVRSFVIRPTRLEIDPERTQRQSPLL